MKKENKKIVLSVIVAAWNQNASLRKCLASLEKQTDRLEVEVIVVSNFSVNFAKDDFSLSVKFINLPNTTIVPELRREGITIAKGEIIAFVEDQCFLDEHWCEEIKRAHKTADIVGGSVENASTARAIDWAVYFYDYGRYMLPNKPGETDALSGMNVSYKRTALEEIQAIYKNGFYETFVNEELKHHGYQLYLAPAAIVYHCKNYQLKRAVEHSYHLARSFAAARVTDVAFSKRFILIVGSLILPFVLTMRIALSTIKKCRHVGHLIEAFPNLLLLLSVWSYGEFCGYLLGAGKSTNQWR